MVLTSREIQLILNLQVYESFYNKNIDEYDALREKLLEEYYKLTGEDCRIEVI